MRVKVDYRTGSKAAYKKFIIEHPEVTITFDEWVEVIYTFNEMFRDYLLETGDRAKLPWGFGSYSISKKRINSTKIYMGKEYMNLRIDWAKTRKAGKRIYHFNSHTDGFLFKWAWFKEDCRLPLRDILVFKPSRVSSRLLAEYLKKPSQYYQQIYKQWSRR